MPKNTFGKITDSILRNGPASTAFVAVFVGVISWSTNRLVDSLSDSRVNAAVKAANEDLRNKLLDRRDRENDDLRARIASLEIASRNCK